MWSVELSLSDVGAVGAVDLQCDLNSIQDGYGRSTLTSAEPSPEPNASVACLLGNPSCRIRM